MRIVQKYGGTSLADSSCIRAAAKRVADRVRQGNRVAVVVSAQGDTTDEILKRAEELNPHGSLRELDACMAAGEQMSAALMAMALGALGCSAVSLTGSQAGIHTDGRWGDAEITFVDNRRILEEWSRGRVAVVAGFQGIGENGDTVTLGRGGSDTTAVALAGALQADRCQIFTDVDGVYNRDPRRYPDAVKYGRIGWAEMLELIGQGAQVLHRRSVETAARYGMEIEVLSAFTGYPGTIVGTEKGFPKEEK